MYKNTTTDVPTTPYCPDDIGIENSGPRAENIAGMLREEDNMLNAIAEKVHAIRMDMRGPSNNKTLTDARPAPSCMIDAIRGNLEVSARILSILDEILEVL